MHPSSESEPAFVLLWRRRFERDWNIAALKNSESIWAWSLSLSLSFSLSLSLICLLWINLDKDHTHTHKRTKQLKCTRLVVKASNKIICVYIIDLQDVLSEQFSARRRKAANSLIQDNSGLFLGTLPAQCLDWQGKHLQNPLRQILQWEFSFAEKAGYTIPMQYGPWRCSLMLARISHRSVWEES